MPKKKKVAKKKAPARSKVARKGMGYGVKSRKSSTRSTSRKKRRGG